MMFLTREDIIGLSLLTLSRRRALSYRNQSIGLLCNSLDWFLYDNVLRHERVNITFDQSDCVLVFANIQTKTCPFADEFVNEKQYMRIFEKSELPYLITCPNGCTLVSRTIL